MRLALLTILTLGCAHQHATRGALEHPDDWTLPAPTTGAMEGFRVLYVDPEAWLSALPHGDDWDPATGDLVLDNTASASADVVIDGTRIARLEPYAIGIIHGMPVGPITVGFALPNGFVKERTLTVTPGEATVDDRFPRIPGQLGAE